MSVKPDNTETKYIIRNKSAFKDFKPFDIFDCFAFTNQTVIF